MHLIEMRQCGIATAMGDARDAFGYYTQTHKFTNWFGSNVLDYSPKEKDKDVYLSAGKNIQWDGDDVLVVNQQCIYHTVFNEKLVDINEYTIASATGTWFDYMQGVFPQAVREPETTKFWVSPPNQSQSQFYMTFKHNMSSARLLETMEIIWKTNMEPKEYDVECYCKEVNLWW